jgi:phosphate/sulfate permease
MEPTIGIALAVIIGLAIFDLWVGVANDAVNFLNSAIGSRIAARRTIYLVAALGVLLGALTSNGLMEVARRGVFDPSVFTNADGTVMLTAILAIYLGVMAADVLMLDLFNTFGLPTSTTVSIVSELVGASIAVALWLTPGGFGEALGVINTGPVLGIYTGIFLSVVVAFTVSALLMFGVRLLLGHDLEQSFPKWGWLWTGASFACLSYFVLYKGFKNAGVVPAGVLDWIGANLPLFLGGVFVVFALLGAIAGRRPRLVMGSIILVGTGALGLAFAGNDLVNFIGPSVAAAQAVFVDGIDLSGKVDTPAWALLIAGGVMVAALLASRKAHRVTDTEIRLASHGATSQRFQRNPFAARLVRASVAVFSAAGRLVPASVRARVAARLNRPPPDRNDPPYDPLRASVNLVVASLLISIGTASGLPLSTTYITFTSAMGAALGDLTWTAEDADQRLAGILTVFGGWIFTGVIAASGAFVMASLIALGGTLGVLAAVALVGLGLWRLAKVHSPSPEQSETLAQPVA